MPTRERVQQQYSQTAKALRALQAEPGTWWNASQLRRPTGWAGKGEVGELLKNIPGVLRRRNKDGNPEWCWDPNVPTTNGIVVDGEERS